MTLKIASTLNEVESYFFTVVNGVHLVEGQRKVSKKKCTNPDNNSRVEIQLHLIAADDNHTRKYHQHK